MFPSVASKYLTNGFHNSQELDRFVQTTSRFGLSPKGTVGISCAKSKQRLFRRVVRPSNACLSVAVPCGHFPKSSCLDRLIRWHFPMKLSFFWTKYVIRNKTKLLCFFFTKCVYKKLLFTIRVHGEKFNLLLYDIIFT